MGALNHNQNLYRSRPWELNRTISFDIFSIETPMLKVETVRSSEIVRVSPLMIEGYRFLLSDTSRYSYMFFNYKSANDIYIKTNNLINTNLNWVKLISFLQYICILSLENTNNILLKNIFRKYTLININRKPNCILNFFNIFLSDSIDLLTLKNLFNFSSQTFGYSNVCFSKKMPISLINNLNRVNLFKDLLNNSINLDLNLTKIVNFQMRNFNQILSLRQNNLNISENNINFLNIFLLFDVIFKIFLDANLNFKNVNLSKLKNFYTIYNFLNNKNLSKNKEKSFFANFSNFSKLNVEKLLKNNKGAFFLNNNTDYNLSFLGYFSKNFNINRNFIFKDFLCVFDISSFINWYKTRKFEDLSKKTFNINFIILRDAVNGLSIPVNSIVTLDDIIYYNGFGDLIATTAIVKSKKRFKSFNFISNYLWKQL